MPRAKTYRNERVQMQVRLPAPLLKRIEKEASKRVVSKTFLVERALVEALDRWEADKELVTNA
jgi:predicted transcriptional regulator